MHHKLLSTYDFCQVLSRRPSSGSGPYIYISSHHFLQEFVTAGLNSGSESLAVHPNLANLGNAQVKNGNNGTGTCSHAFLRPALVPINIFGTLAHEPKLDVFILH